MNRQLIFAVFLFVFYFLVSTLVYFKFGDPGMTVNDAIYMTAISFTTIGYGDTGFATTDFQKLLFTPLFLWGFLIQVIFVAGIINAFVATKIHIKIEDRYMEFKMKFKKEHIIIFGVGKISPHIIAEMVKVRANFVVVDTDLDAIEKLRAQYKGIAALHMQIKPFTHNILKKVNIATAKVTILDLGSDELNHIAGDIIQKVNEKIRIIAVNDNIEFLPIMDRDGKLAINSHILCAMRISSLAFRPSVVTYLDKMLYKKDGIFRIEEVTVAGNSSIIGETLENVFEKTGLKVLVIGIEDYECFDIIPKGEIKPAAGMTLYVQGEVSQIEILRKLATGETTLHDVKSK